MARAKPLLVLALLLGCGEGPGSVECNFRMAVMNAPAGQAGPVIEPADLMLLQS